MQNDSKEITPGSAAYWDRFYSGSEKATTKEMKQAIADGENSDSKGVPLVRWNEDLVVKFDWFMPFADYWPVVKEFFKFSPFTTDTVPSSGEKEEKRTLLHVGCGNSVFPEEFISAVKGELAETTSSTTGGKGKRGGRRGKDKAAGTERDLSPKFASGYDILNTDICVGIIQTLRSKFDSETHPEKTYAVGDVCKMCASSPIAFESKKGIPSSCWYQILNQGQPNESSIVREGSVDLIFDKGTVDALLSGFAGGRGDAANPNVRSYASEALKVLKKPTNGTTGGRIVLLSINAKEIVEPYFYLAGTVFAEEEEFSGDEDSTSISPYGFELEHFDTIDYDRKRERAKEVVSGEKEEDDNPEENGGEKDEKQDWIHSYGTVYTLFVFKVVADT